MATHLSSWRAALATMACVDILVAVGFVLLLPKSRNFVVRPTLEIRSHLEAWYSHLRRPELAILFAISFLGMGSFVTVYNYVSFRLLAPPYRLSQAQIGLIFLSYVFGMVASIIAGIFADRFRRDPIIMLGALVMITGLGLTLLQPLIAVIVGIIMVTIGFFMVHSVASGWVGLLANRDKGHAASLYLLAYYLGSSTLGSLGGWFWHERGWNAVVGFCCALMIGVLCVAMFLKRLSTS